MAFLSTALSAPNARVATGKPAKPGLLSRLLRAMVVSRHHQADLEISRYLALSGGKMTDTAERVIEQRFLNSQY
ncbi:MAG: hypothetical protein OJF62_000976 [Pseudolabrys sp.]|jgi:hypothetical protein|nr:hypothetical protein [Pseudolabrys sp.]